MYLGFIPTLLQVVDSYWLPEVLSSPCGVKARPLGMVSVVFSHNMLFAGCDYVLVVLN
jgi:hypothetical protein